jgi:hypothetical protein
MVSAPVGRRQRPLAVANLLRKQGRAGVREFHINTGSMFPKPAIGDGRLKTGAVFVDAAALTQERQIDQLDMDTPTASTVLAIWISLRAALSGSENGRSDLSFMVLACP